MKFANELRRLRQLHNLTQSDLADNLNISRSAISMYERGEREPDFETIEKIADYFNVRISNLMDSQPAYYENDSTAAIAQEIFESKELRLLFDAAKDADPEDLKTVHTILLALKRKERNEDK